MPKETHHGGRVEVTTQCSKLNREGDSQMLQVSQYLELYDGGLRFQISEYLSPNACKNKVQRIRSIRSVIPGSQDPE